VPARAGQYGTMQTTDVVHNADESRYELRRDGAEIGVADYRLLPGDDGEPTVAEFHHTLINPADRGQGHAERLVQAAMDDVRTRGLRVKPTCWYVDQFLIEHPDYADLRA
jgi:predicted GNAT family acetyltransferase